MFLEIPFQQGIWQMRYTISIIKQEVVNLKAKWSEQNSRAVAMLLGLLNTDHCISLRCRHTHTDCKMVWQQVVWTLESWQPEDCKGKTGSLLAVTARALIYTWNTPIMPTGSAGIEWPAPDRISSDQVQVSLSVKCFTTGRILPLTDGDAWDKPTQWSSFSESLWHTQL